MSQRKKISCEEGSSSSIPYRQLSGAVSTTYSVWQVWLESCMKLQAMGSNKWHPNGTLYCSQGI